MPQLLPFRTRPSPMHPEAPNLSLLRTTPYSLGSPLPEPHLPHGRRYKSRFQAAAPPPLPIARTAATIMMPSPESARLGQSPHLNPRPPHLPTKNYPTPPPIVRKPGCGRQWPSSTHYSRCPFSPPYRPFHPEAHPANPRRPRPPQRVPASTHWPGPAASNSLSPFGPSPEIINSPDTTSCQGLAPADELTLVQQNSLGSWDVFLSLFSSLTEGPPPDMVLLQDPLSSKGFLPSFSGFKSFAPPVGRPRVAC